MGHDVRRVRELPQQGQLAVAAVGMKRPLVGVLEAESGDGVGRVQARGAEAYVVEPGLRRRLDLNAQPAGHLPSVDAALLLGGLLRLVPVHPDAAPRPFAGLHRATP